MTTLTPSQQAALKAHIDNDAGLTALRMAGNYGGIATALNAIASPPFVLWRTLVTRDECQSEGFDWVQVDNLSVGQARIWEWLFDPQSQTMCPAEPGARAGVSECWKGTAAKVAVATFVLNKCKRNATVLEKLCATGTGSNASPATPGKGPDGYIEGELQASDLYTLWG